MVGYGRLEGQVAAEALSRLYSASRLFVNFFQPSFKLAENKRNGARVIKRYHAPETPCARLLASPSITNAAKERLRTVFLTLAPLRLLDEIRVMQQHLASLAAGDLAHHLPHRTAKELFERLRDESPQKFPSSQLRTLQRRIKQWTSDAARRLVFAEPVPYSHRDTRVRF